MLAGCANMGSGGDFGRVRPDLVSDSIHDWVGPAAAIERHDTASTFPLTDDERRLRDLAYPYIEPPYERQQWYSVAGEYGLRNATFAAESADRTAYFKHMRGYKPPFGPEVRSPSSLYAKLLDDIRDDDSRLPDFYATATRVIDIDGKRRESLHYITDLPKSERVNALRRIRENAAIISLVETKLRQRTASYRYALAQLVVQTPSPQAAEVERALNTLKADIARHEEAPTPTWQRQKSLASSS